jgi:hypothetical protein
MLRKVELLLGISPLFKKFKLFLICHFTPDFWLQLGQNPDLEAKKPLQLAILDEV